MKLKVIFPLKQIPVPSLIRKINGEVKYTVQKTIKIYDAAGESQEIQAKEGAVFLINPRGAIDVGDSTEVVWNTTLEKINELYEDVY